MIRVEALEVLEGGDFDPFIGVPESLEVEFKGQPYQLDQDSQRFELAKDVSAFANAAGGVVVIGARTHRDDQSAVDIVQEIRLLTRDLVDVEQYVDTISERVYPGLRELRVRFCPVQGDDERGLVAIDVPPQPEIDRYFLIQKPFDEGVDRTPGWLIGLAVRGVGRVELREVGEIHTLINRGLTVGLPLAEILDSVAELREVGTPTAEPEATPADRLADVIEERVNEIGT